LQRRAWLIAIAAFAVAVALIVVRPHSTPGPTLRDFEAYHAAGAAWNAQEDPYSRAVWNDERTIAGVDSSRDELLPFVGPPSSLPLFSLFARIAYSRATIVWSMLLSVALIATVLLTLRLARIPYSWYTLLAAAALSIGFAPITSDLALGQVALLAFAGAVVAIVFYERRVVAAALGIIVAALQPNVALPLVALLTKRNGLRAAIAGALVTFALGAWALGAGWAVTYAQTLAPHAGAEMLSAIQQTPVAVAYGFGLDANASKFIGRIATFATTVVAIVVMVVLRDVRHRFVVLCAMLPWGATFFHEHDLLVAFAPAVWCARYASGARRSIGLIATLLVAIDWLGLAQRPDGIAQSAFLALAAACGYLALTTSQTSSARSTWLAVATAAAVFAFGAWIGAQHPAPIWPDALGAYHAPANTSAAAVWESEQRITGLLDVQPAWALLRSFALIGSVLLAVAAALSPPQPL